MTQTISHAHAWRPGGAPGEPTRIASRLAIFACALAGWGTADTAFAHGFAGKRFFPATLATDDPFVADELSLPTVSRTKTAASGDEPATRTTTTSLRFTNGITPDFEL